MLKFATLCGIQQLGVRDEIAREPSEGPGQNLAIDRVKAVILQCPTVTRVAGQSLVAAFPGEHHDDMLTGQLGHKV